MWNCRKSVLLPAKRRKAGARPLARVTSRRELGRGERGLRGLRDGPALRAPAPARWPRGSGARHGSAALPGTAQHGPARRGAERSGHPRSCARLRGFAPAKRCGGGAGPPRLVAARRSVGPGCAPLPVPPGQVQRRGGGSGAPPQPCRAVPCRTVPRARRSAARRRRRPTGPSERACGAPLCLPDLPSREGRGFLAVPAPPGRGSSAQLQPGSAPSAGLEVPGSAGL